MSSIIVRFPDRTGLRQVSSDQAFAVGSRGVVLRPAIASWRSGAPAHAIAVQPWAHDLLAAVGCAERLVRTAGAVCLIGRDYHAGLAMQIARLKATLASHGLDGERTQTGAAAMAAPFASAPLLLVAALAAATQAVASIAQARAAKCQSEEPAPADVAILASGLAALVAATAFTFARDSAAAGRSDLMAELAGVAGDLLKALTMKRPNAPRFLKLLGAVEDLLLRLDDSDGRPVLAS